uniref:Putative secreted peptide n=1 Tax=Anopheles braziliensis TaxID=58242 RepID=A0A2M3ZSI8_9DIPT
MFSLIIWFVWRYTSGSTSSCTTGRCARAGWSRPHIGRRYQWRFALTITLITLHRYLPIRVSVFPDVHLGKRANITDADHINGEVAEKVNQLWCLRA